MATAPTGGNTAPVRGRSTRQRAAVAAAQQISRSFKATFAVAVAIGIAVSLAGTVTSYYQDVPPGATIVLLAIAVFVTLTALAAPLARRRARAVEANTAECTADLPGTRRPSDDVKV